MLRGKLEATITGPKTIRGLEDMIETMVDVGRGQGVLARHRGLARRSRTHDTKTGLAESKTKRRMRLGWAELRKRTKQLCFACPGMGAKHQGMAGVHRAVTKKISGVTEDQSGH